ncbi:unnamed protein product [Brassica rapa]|uniref:MMS19 nucleotide excision repair protein n=3 Tax=Brassica TaxID=3705 RepID=A0A078GMY7_BRANA|nr:unnamed protein product [Brassica napus]CAG7869348.1 unnamed protein product [Brassica rapa]CDY26711.1 BnaA06g13110D [Brassica napus]VDC66089.1 unnamed protein product [Brassica rapa]
MTAFVKRSVSSVQSAASHREVSLRQDLQTVSGGDRTQTPHFLGIGLSLSLPRKVVEMDLYLTTTDDVVRTRGILLLAVMLDHLKLKPLDNAVVHSLIGFFTAKLEKRSSRCGHCYNSSAIDAEAVAKEIAQSIQVQSLALHHRKLCFEQLECLLEQYPDAMINLGDLIVYATCEAIDGEKERRL